MKLQLLDINGFIQKNNCKEVLNSKITPRGADPQSLWSETIFGTIGSRDRRTQYGYIQLKNNLFKYS